MSKKPIFYIRMHVKFPMWLYNKLQLDFDSTEKFKGTTVRKLFFKSAIV